MYDLGIINGKIVDGSGNGIYNKSNIYICGNKIVKISNNILRCKNIINANNYIVSPGFIDIHTHSDLSCIQDNNMESKVFQGVTTELVGNCGNSAFPSNGKNKVASDRLNKLLVRSIKDTKINNQSITTLGKQIEDLNSTINWASLIGHGTLRSFVMGYENRKPTARELNKMCGILSDELEKGAFGLSLGLIYPPSSFADTNEIITLAKILKSKDALLAVHLRDEREKIFEAIEEMIHVAIITGVRVQISHLKLAGTAQWHKTEKLFRIIDDAKNQGLSFSADQYPYTASSTGLSSLVPKWAHNGGKACMLDRLKGSNKNTIINEINAIIKSRGGENRIVIATTYGKFPNADGKSLDTLSKEYKICPAEMVAKILIDCDGVASGIYHSMNEDDLKTILKRSDIAVASDGRSLTVNTENIIQKPHPRNFGTFPRALKIIRDNNLMSIDKAVYKMTGLPAKLLKITDRGIIKCGNIADIVVFDYDNIDDVATFDNPIAYPKGIKNVIVSGTEVLRNNILTGKSGGKFIRK